MPRKYKLTGCAKFFIFLVIAAPLAYIGASYYNGQDPIGEIKEFVQSFTKNEAEGDDNVPVTETTETTESQSAGSGTVYQKMELKDLEIKTLKNDLNDCKSINTKQKELIDALEKEIETLKKGKSN